MSNRKPALLILLAAAILSGPAPIHADDEPEPQEMVILPARKLEYIQVPDMPKCVTAAILRGNPRTDAAWVLLKLASGCSVPWHWHTANESLVVISGQGKFEMKKGKPLEFAPGAYAALPTRHVHRAVCTRECLLFNTADAAFDVHYVDDDGKEISLKKAVKAMKKEMSAPPTPAPKKK